MTRFLHFVVWERDLSSFNLGDIFLLYAENGFKVLKILCSFHAIKQGGSKRLNAFWSSLYFWCEGNRKEIRTLREYERGKEEEN